MRAGIFMGVATNEEISELMDTCQLGIIIEQRMAELSVKWQEESIDYSHYDQPTSGRKGLF